METRIYFIKVILKYLRDYMQDPNIYLNFLVALRSVNLHEL